MNKESYIKCSSAKLHILTLELGHKKSLTASYPVEVFYVISGQAGLHKASKPIQRLAAGEFFEIVEGNEAEIVSYSHLELLHLALPDHLKDSSPLKNIGRQICALQYFTKYKLSEISERNSQATPEMVNAGVDLNALDYFGISEPEMVQKDSEILFKTILKNYLTRQRKEYDRS